MKEVLAVAALGLVLTISPATTQSLTAAENGFTFDLYRELGSRQPSGNLVFSPYGIASAIGMAYIGAKGATASEIATMLHLAALPAAGVGANPQSRFVTALEQQHVLPNFQKDGFQFYAANGLWVAQGYRLKPAYAAEIDRAFGAALNRIDFANAVTARSVINAWVTKETANKIRNLVGPGALSAATRMVLTDAVYFKAGWAHAFDTRATHDEPFHVSIARTVTAKMMNTAGYFKLATVSGGRILTIPYRHDDASMVIVLPDATNGLAAIEKEIAAGKLDRWLAGGAETLISLTLPKFTASSSLGLGNVLAGLGMKSAFDPARADFTGIADAPPGKTLAISAAIHRAYIAVDENGTEATAATAVTIEPTAAYPQVSFVADHPFLYLIRANASGAILFIGQLVDPTAER